MEKILPVLLLPLTMLMAFLFGKFEYLTHTEDHCGLKWMYFSLFVISGVLAVFFGLSFIIYLFYCADNFVNFIIS